MGGEKGWCDAATIDEIEAPKSRSDGEIELLTVAEAENLLRVAEKHFPEAVASYALAMFAEVRPKWPQNALRHSHASYAIASGSVPVEGLLFEFGHTATVDVLRGHYVGRASKRDAGEFFRILPKGTENTAALRVVC